MQKTEQMDSVGHMIILRCYEQMLVTMKMVIAMILCVFSTFSLLIHQGTPHIITGMDDNASCLWSLWSLISQLLLHRSCSTMPARTISYACAMVSMCNIYLYHYCLCLCI